MAGKNEKSKGNKQEEKADAKANDETQSKGPNDVKRRDQAVGTANDQEKYPNVQCEQIFENFLGMVREELNNKRVPGPSSLNKDVLRHTDKIMKSIKGDLLKKFRSKAILKDNRFYWFQYKDSDKKFDRGPSPYFSIEKMKTFGKFEFVANCWIFASILLLPRIQHHFNSKRYLLAEYVSVCALRLIEKAMYAIPSSNAGLNLYLLTVSGWTVKCFYNGHVSDPPTDADSKYEEDLSLKIRKQCDDLLSYENFDRPEPDYDEGDYMDCVKENLFQNLGGDIISKPMTDEQLICQLGALMSLEMRRETIKMQGDFDEWSSSRISMITTISSFFNALHLIMTLRDRLLAALLSWDWGNFWFILSYYANPLEIGLCLGRALTAYEWAQRFFGILVETVSTVFTKLCEALMADSNTAENILVFFLAVIPDEARADAKFASTLSDIKEIVNNVEDHCGSGARGTFLTLALMAVDHGKVGANGIKLKPHAVEQVRECYNLVLLFFLAHRSNFGHSVELFMDLYQYFHAKIKYQLDIKNISIVRPALLFLLFPYPMFRYEQELRKLPRALETSKLKDKVKVYLENAHRFLTKVGAHCLGLNVAKIIPKRSEKNEFVSCLLALKDDYLPFTSRIIQNLKPIINLDELRSLTDLTSLRKEDGVNIIPAKHKASRDSLDQKLVLWCKNIGKCIYLMLQKNEREGLNTREQSTLADNIHKNDEALKLLSKKLKDSENQTDFCPLEQVLNAIEEVAVLLELDFILKYKQWDYDVKIE